MNASNQETGGARLYRIGVAAALLTSFLIVWTTIVRDQGSEGFFLLIMAAGVGAFAAWFQPTGMARTMFGVAIMQATFGIAVATAPSTASVPGGPSGALLFNTVFALLWLVSAALFRASANRQS